MVSILSAPDFFHRSGYVKFKNVGIRVSKISFVFTIHNDNRVEGSLPLFVHTFSQGGGVQAGKYIISPFLEL